MNGTIRSNEDKDVNIDVLKASANNGNREQYSQLLKYVQAHGRLSYSDFEAALLRDICLFNVPDDEYLREVEATLDQIIRSLPSFKRVFARPIIRLKDEHQIVPVEAVKVIDKRSLTHVASRCELWEDITEDGIKPRKLMTLEHVETYSIYENIAFAYAVDSILAYIKNTLRRIKDVVYGCRDIHFNLLDRTHHNLYFLAVGKLYYEYVRSRSSQENWSRCIDKMMFIDKTLRLKLNSPVYLKCKRKSYNIKLKKTNIFRSHKDYAEVFKILKIFETGVGSLLGEQNDVCSSDEEYKTFCKMLAVFATGHFNYEFGKYDVIDVSHLDKECSFLGWKLRMRQVSYGDLDALSFTTRKNREYTTCMLFGEKDGISPAVLDGFKRRWPADEYLFCTPTVYGDHDQIYLSVFDIDSFRRIQQVLLRGMIISDTDRTHCPFCGNALTATDKGHTCDSCNAEIISAQCPDTGKIYHISDIIKVRSSFDEQKTQDRRKFLHDRLDEAQLHFRNITPITHDGRAICPHCNRHHIN